MLSSFLWFHSLKLSFLRFFFKSLLSVMYLRLYPPTSTSYSQPGPPIPSLRISSTSLPVSPLKRESNHRLSPPIYSFTPTVNSRGHLKSLT